MNLTKNYKKYRLKNIFFEDCLQNRRIFSLKSQYREIFKTACGRLGAAGDFWYMSRPKIGLHKNN